MGSMLSILDDVVTGVTSLVGSLALGVLLIRVLTRWAHKLRKGKRITREVRLCRWWSDDGVPVYVYHVVYFRGSEPIGYVDEPFSPFGETRWGVFLGILEMVMAYVRPMMDEEKLAIKQMDMKWGDDGENT